MLITHQFGSVQERRKKKRKRDVKETERKRRAHKREQERRKEGEKKRRDGSEGVFHWEISSVPDRPEAAEPHDGCLFPVE